MRDDKVQRDRSLVQQNCGGVDVKKQQELDRFLSLTGQLSVINLPERRDRYREFEEQLEAIGLSFSDPRVRVFKATRPKDAAGFPTLGARGCFLSHLGVLREALTAEQAQVLICEDDLDFVDDFGSRLNQMISELERQEWSIFYGGYGLPLSGKPVGPGIIEIDPNNGVMCMHFYVVRGTAIKDLVLYLEAVLSRAPGDAAGGPMHVDGALSRFRADFPHHVTLAASTPLGFQRSSRTDIHATRWFDRVPVVKNGISALRRLRNFMR